LGALRQTEPLSTTHLSVADAEGGVVALTSAIEARCGAQIIGEVGTGLPGGFLLNNQLTDFAPAPRDAQGLPLDAALAAPVLASINGAITFVESGRLDRPTLDGLRARGDMLQPLALASGLHALQRVGRGWRAAADPRRVGAVRGD
jgi:gamma-glutamyltranspeptidase/glutathione hydrolase